MFGSLREQGIKGACTIRESYTLQEVVKEIDYCVAYLFDAPDELLKPYADDIGLIGEQLMKLKECVRKGDTT